MKIRQLQQLQISSLSKFVYAVYVGIQILPYSTVRDYTRFSRVLQIGSTVQQ